MLSIEGYDSLQFVWKTALGTIRNKLKDERALRVAAAEERGEKRPAFSHMLSNVEFAAEFLIYDIIARLKIAGKGSACVLRPDGVHLHLPPAVFLPRASLSGDSGYFAAREQAFLEAGLLDDELVFGVKSLSMPYWPVLFVNEPLFKMRSMSMRGLPREVDKFIAIVDLENGCFDFTRLKAYWESIDLFKRGTQLIETAGIEPSMSIVDLVSREEQRSGNLRPLLPFDGCSIILPKEWMSMLFGDSSAPAVPIRERNGEDTSYHRILSIIQAEETIKKPLIKDRAATELGMAGREFERVWADIDFDHPELQLSRPGPKPKRRAN